MPGGMNKRGSWGPMANRIAGAHQTVEPEPPAHLKHVWVTDRHGRLPALLLEWRRILPDRAWEGHVVHAVLDEHGDWHVVEEWLPAGLLDPL